MPKVLKVFELMNELGKLPAGAEVYLQRGEETHQAAAVSATTVVGNGTEWVTITGDGSGPEEGDETEL